MFPWLCFKCGAMCPDKDELISHIREEGHILNEEEIRQLTDALAAVGDELYS